MNRIISLKLIPFLMLFYSPLILAQQKTTTLDCLIKPEMYIDISSPVGGVLESVSVKKTESIKKGQVLAQLQAKIELARVNVAEQEAKMATQVKAKGIKLAYAKRKLKRVSGLYKEDASSAQEQDDAATELAIARTDFSQIKLDKTKNELKLLLAKAELDQKTILSPIDGIVVERYLMPGESVNGEPILQLAKIDPLLVEVVAPSSFFGLVKKGMVVEIKPDYPANSTYQAKVTMVDGIIDAASGSFSIRLALPNPDKQLVAGTKCIGMFPFENKQITKPGSNKNSADDALPEDIKILLGQ